MDVGVFQGRKIHVTGGRGYFGHKLRNELKNMGKKNLGLRPCLFHYWSRTVRYCEDLFNNHVSQFKYMTFILTCFMIFLFDLNTIEHFGQSNFMSYKKETITMTSFMFQS